MTGIDFDNLILHVCMLAGLRDFTVQLRLGDMYLVLPLPLVFTIASCRTAKTVLLFCGVLHALGHFSDLILAIMYHHSGR